MLATNATNAALLLSSALVASMTACASSRDAVPEGAHVETLQTQSLVLRGTAPPHPGSASCGSSATPTSQAHLLELREDATANIELRPTRGVAVLHVAKLGTPKTWCAMTKGDGTGATIPGDFATGVYAISVESSRTGEPLPYQVVFEKM